jgi:lipid-binding SYLF domain-containing protein
VAQVWRKIVSRAFCLRLITLEIVMIEWKQALAVGGITLVGLAGTASSIAEGKSEIDGSVVDALKPFYANDPKHKELATEAAGMLVFPRIVKGGAGIAGEHGEGVLQVNGRTVHYYSVGGGSVGLTLGAGERSEIIMFMTQDALDKFTHSKGWTIGADAGVAVVSEGAGATYDSKTMQKPILGFVYDEKGLIGDLSLTGSKISRIKR